MALNGNPPDFPIRLPLQRRRVWRACESCRRKKIKCDGREPVCSQCTQTSSACNWIQTKDRAALSRHYVQELEARLIQMEGLLTQVGSVATTQEMSSQSPSLPSSGSIPLEPPLAAQDSQPSTSQTIPSQHALSTSSPYSLDPVVPPESEPDHFGQLAMDHNGHLRWIGSSSAMTLVDAFRNITNRAARLNPGGDLRSRSFKPEAKIAAQNLYFPPILRFNTRALPGPEEAEFPPRDLADKLVAAYFTHFHHTLPVVDSTSFLSQYRRLMDNRRISTPTETGFATVVFAVFACAARFVDDPRLVCKEPDRVAGGMAAVYYERAMVLYYIGHTATQLAHVQAFILLASFLASINSLPQSWLLCGQAVRVAQDLGLHRSPQHLLLTPIDKETRRKVWWCAYGLDRMLAVALGRPLGIDDADCDVELPLDIDDVALPQYFAGLNGRSVKPAGQTSRPTSGSGDPPVSLSLMKGFNALTCLFKIAGQVLRSVYALDKCKENLEEDKMAELQNSVDRLDRLLTEWCEKLPAPFKSNPQTSQQVSLGAILCSCYYAVTVTLHRNFIPTSVASRQLPRSSSVAKAVTASRSCIFLAQSIKDVIPSSHWLAFFSQYLFSSAIIILLCIMHATDQNAVTTAMNEVNAAIDCLGTLEASWPGAKKCREILKELADMSLLRLQDNSGSNSGSPSIRRTGLTDRFVTDGTTIRSPGRHLGHTAISIPASPYSAHPGSNLRRKRTADDMTGLDGHHHSFRQMPPPSPASSAFTASPASVYSSHTPVSTLGSDAVVGGAVDAAGTDSSSSYAFTGSSATTPQYSQPWSTPRSAAASLGLDGSGTLPVDLMSPSHQPSNPFSVSYNTPSTMSVQLDSAYLPSFAYSLSGETALPAQSPVHFDLSDLPFSGMDFLQSLGGTLQDEHSSDTNEEALWAQLSASPFKVGPDLPFVSVEPTAAAGSSVSS